MSWWTDKLGTAPVPAPFQQRPVPVGLPVQYQQPQAPQYPGQQPQQPLAPPQSFEQAVQMIAAGQMQTTGDKNGIRANGETDSCPQCNDPFFFHRTSAKASAGNGAGGRIMKPDGSYVHAAPRCMSCGYTAGRFEQFADDSGAAYKILGVIDQHSPVLSTFNGNGNL